MTAGIRAIKRHDTSEEWVFAGGCSPSHASSSEIWTILSEAQVEISYKEALSASPVTTAPCSPDTAGQNGRRSVSVALTSCKSVRPMKAREEAPTVASESEDGCEMYRMRKGRVAGGSSSKSRNNRRK